jgi:hypothetical protein
LSERIAKAATQTVDDEARFVGVGGGKDGFELAIKPIARGRLGRRRMQVEKRRL